MTEIQRTNIAVCNEIIAQLESGKDLRLTPIQYSLFEDLVADFEIGIAYQCWQEGGLIFIGVDQLNFDSIYHMLSSYIAKHTPSKIDRFIADGGFDKAFNDVFGLPVGVVESLGEVP